MAFPLLSVASIIDEFNVGPLTLTRRGPPTRNSYGEYVPAAGVNIVVNPIAVHNLSGKDRSMLPEAIRDNETIEGYTKIQVYSGNDGKASDVLAYDGRNWVCVLTMDYERQGGVFISYWQLEDVQA